MFNVGDKVTCLMFGEGVVREVKPCSVKYPVIVDFGGCQTNVSYTTDGKFHVDGRQTLYSGTVDVQVTPVITVDVAILPTGEWCELQDRALGPKVVSLTKKQFDTISLCGLSVWRKLWENAYDVNSYDEIIGR